MYIRYMMHLISSEFQTTSSTHTLVNVLCLTIGKVSFGLSIDVTPKLAVLMHMMLKWYKHILLTLGLC